MNPEINNLELKNAIVLGCDEYLDARKRGLYLKGFYHGKSGESRALKAKEYANQITSTRNYDPNLLLALLLAVFNSTSKGLAMCIALQLIKGNFSVLGSVIPCLLEDSLASPAFSKKILKNAIRKDENLIEVEFTIDGPIFEVDKRKLVRSTLNKQAPKGFFFRTLISNFQSNLEDSSTVTINPELLDNTFVIF